MGLVSKEHDTAGATPANIRGDEELSFHLCPPLAPFPCHQSWAPRTGAHPAETPGDVSSRHLRGGSQAEALSCLIPRPITSLHRQPERDTRAEVLGPGVLRGRDWVGATPAGPRGEGAAGSRTCCGPAGQEGAGGTESPVALCPPHPQGRVSSGRSASGQAPSPSGVQLSPQPRSLPPVTGTQHGTSQMPHCGLQTPARCSLYLDCPFPSARPFSG